MWWEWYTISMLKPTLLYHSHFVSVKETIYFNPIHYTEYKAVGHTNYHTRTHTNVCITIFAIVVVVTNRGELIGLLQRTSVSVVFRERDKKCSMHAVATVAIYFRVSAHRRTACGALSTVDWLDSWRWCKQCFNARITISSLSLVAHSGAFVARDPCVDIISIITILGDRPAKWVSSHDGNGTGRWGGEGLEKEYKQHYFIQQNTKQSAYYFGLSAKRNATQNASRESKYLRNALLRFRKVETREIHTSIYT